jgi:hypothetical protein
MAGILCRSANPTISSTLLLLKSGYSTDDDGARAALDYGSQMTPQARLYWDIPLQ